MTQQLLAVGFIFYTRPDETKLRVEYSIAAFTAGKCRPFSLILHLPSTRWTRCKPLGFSNCGMEAVAITTNLQSECAPSFSVPCTWGQKRMSDFVQKRIAHFASIVQQGQGPRKFDHLLSEVALAKALSCSVKCKAPALRPETVFI